MVLIFEKRKAALPVILKQYKMQKIFIQNLSLLQVDLYYNNIRLGFE